MFGELWKSEGTKSFSSGGIYGFVNEMPIKTIQPFVSNFNAFAEKDSTECRFMIG